MMSAPSSLTWSAYIAFTVPAVPTGMKAGVRTAPRPSCSAPVRAAPSWACTEKETPGEIVIAGFRSGFGTPQQAGIAVGVETVASVDRMGIGCLHRLIARKGGDEHHQRRTRQVEIGHQRIGGAE